jgi:hypothetical protein
MLGALQYTRFRVCLLASTTANVNALNKVLEICIDAIKIQFGSDGS